MGWLNCRYNGPANPEGPVYSVPVKDNPPPERQVNWPLTSSKVINGNNSFSYYIQEDSKHVVSYCWQVIFWIMIFKDTYQVY